MIMKPCRDFFVVMLVFCCIFACAGTDMRTTSERRKEARGWQEVCLKNEDGNGGRKSHSGFRYVRLYASDGAYVVVDLGIVVGVLALLLLFLLMTRKVF